MKPRLPRPKRQRLGAAMVEFGFCIIIFMWLLLATFEFGRLYMVTMIMNIACRAAARDAVANPNISTAQIKSNMLDVCERGGLDRSKLEVYVLDANLLDVDPDASLNLPGMMGTWPDPAPGELNMSKAKPRQLGIFRIQVQFGDVALVAPKWISSGMKVAAQVVMRKE